MNPEAKRLWLEALRSGRYRQERGWLHLDGGGYCCLGVLCDVAIKAGVTVKVRHVDDEWDGCAVVSYDGAETFPPESVMAWAELPDCPTVEVPETDLLECFSPSVSLTTLNDDLEWSFAQIADAIERDL